jgi:hypothetical protein
MESPLNHDIPCDLVSFLSFLEPINYGFLLSKGFYGRSVCDNAEDFCGIDRSLPSLSTNNAGQSMPSLA